MTLPHTLQAARDFVSCHTCGCLDRCGDGRLNKGECHRHNAKLIVAMIDDELAALHEPLPPQTEEEVGAECERILSMSEGEVGAELRAQGLNPAWEAERARIIAKCAIWHHERAARTEPPVPPDCVKPLLERLREYLCKRSDAMGGDDNSEEVYFIWEIDAAMARSLRAAERG